MIVKMQNDEKNAKFWIAKFDLQKSKLKKLKLKKNRSYKIRSKTSIEIQIV